MFSSLNSLFLFSLNFFATSFGGNYALGIIALTLAIRLALLPIILPSIKSQKKLADLRPQLSKIKDKYGHDKQLHSKKQLELYQQHQINPAAGCLPQIVQIVLFIAFYRFLITSLNDGPTGQFSYHFFWLTLNQPDTTLILPAIAALSQLVLGIMLKPGADTAAEKKLAGLTKTKKDDKEAQDMTEMAATMQSQMILVMPVITFFIAFRFPSGLALYWVVSTLFSLGQQYFVSGLGGLRPLLAKLNLINSST